MCSLLNDEFLKDDAFFAINGVKMDLKIALKINGIESKIKKKREIIDSAVSTLKSIEEKGYSKVMGYKYCIAILCLHFQDMIDPVDKLFLFGSSWNEQNSKKYGLDLMTLASSPSTKGGDDDIDAANYLLNNNKNKK